MSDYKLLSLQQITVRIVLTKNEVLENSTAK